MWAWIKTVTDWLYEHIDHFAISCGVSILVTMATKPVMAHMPQILHFLHIPARWFGM